MFAGDVNELRFLKHIIQIDSLTFEDSNHYESIKVRPCYIDHIKYRGIRYCASEGRECPVYSGIMFFIGGNGKRYEYSFEDKIDNKGHRLYQINPVRIVFINDSILSITHDTGDPLEPGDGFYYYKYYDKYAGVTVCQIHVASKAEKNKTALIKARYHMFVRALEGAFITLNQDKKLYLTRRNYAEIGGETWKVFEAAVCDDCGRIGVAGKTVHDRLETAANRYDEELEVYLLQVQGEKLDLDENDDAEVSR